MRRFPEKEVGVQGVQRAGKESRGTKKGKRRAMNQSRGTSEKEEVVQEVQEVERGTG